MIEGHCRGGFATSELDDFIPGWRDELDELTQLRAENERLRAENERLRADGTPY
jgi:cell shape-determining protein MreC